MEGLTRIINGHAHGEEGINREKLTGKYCRGEFEATACIEKLATYEDAEEQGLLLRFPIPLGTEKLYFVDDGEWYTLDVDMLSIKKMPVSGRIMFEIDGYEFYDEDFGKIVFFTKAEAEEALRKMKGSKGNYDGK